jgi:GTP-binding protein YchF
MSISSGIIGLPQSGKTTVFNALTGGRADTASHVEGPAPHVGVARVPEPRLDALQKIFNTKKAVLAEARYIDVGASVKSLARDKGLGGELLNQLSAVDNLICVIRAFKDDSIPHPAGSLDVPRDIATLDLELVFSDLAIMERRLEKLEVSLKGAKPAERPVLLQEKDVLLHLKAGLEADRPVRELTLEPIAARLITNYQFLTAKPLLIVANIGEEQLQEASALEKQLNARYAAGKRRVTALCGKLEMELAQLDSAAAAELRAGYGLSESGLERTIKASYELADLITFLTAAPPNEVRAWSIKKGTTAVKAAGRVHTDMEKGFIRAETIGFDVLARCGSLAEARKQGLLRLEGKDYVVQDGDVITFLFNV